ncbi:MAG: thrombospondin type 3 repeat-containing protein [Oligoflexia bacterium]
MSFLAPFSALTLGILGTLSSVSAAPASRQDPDRSIEWVRDLDRDGVVDALDWDRDGDLVHDKIDAAPEDPKIQGVDSDFDRVPDSVDWADPEAGRLQAILWQKTGILWISSPSAVPTIENLVASYEWILRAKAWGITFDQLQIIEIVDQWKGPSAHAERLGARYDPHLRLIQIRTEKEPNAPKLESRLAHELAHAIQQARPALKTRFNQLTGWSAEQTLLGPIWTYRNGETFELFLESALISQPELATEALNGPEFISQAAKLGGEEMFAETWAYLEGGNLPPSQLVPIADWMKANRKK